MRVPLTRSGSLMAGVVAALLAGLVTGPATGSAAASARPGVIKVPVFTMPLTRVGQVDLGALAKSEHRRRAAMRIPGAAGARYRLIDTALLAHMPHGHPASSPNPATIGYSAVNVPGESGFSALGGVQQAAVSGFDLEPPDQGLCAGGGYLMEFINNAISIYTAYGAQLVAPVKPAAAFLKPHEFFSDPRCYYDAPTKRWFFQELVVGSLSRTGQVLAPSQEFEAVSNTPDPTGTYTVYSWNTTDAHTAGCPCFGDYDNLGADNNGIYVTTAELGIASGAANGVIVYAISKQQLEDGARVGVIPPVIGYRLTSDPLGTPFVIAPATTPPGTRYAQNTEYFVESDTTQLSDNRLLVYALHNTTLLAAHMPPKLYQAELTSEPYAFPPDATQKPGPRPLGRAYQEPAGGLQADFTGAMEPVYAGGRIFAAIDTGTAGGSDAAGWFIIQPTLSGSTLSATIAHQGMVAVKDTSLLYPYTAVDGNGHGYLLFSLSGPHNYPSPAYIRYTATGPTGPVIVATAGAAPDDSFGCYAAFVGPFNGGCRWGDYSMGAVMNGRVFMAAEMIPQGYRDTLSNWGTYIWSAPPP